MTINGDDFTYSQTEVLMVYRTIVDEQEPYDGRPYLFMEYVGNFRGYDIYLGSLGYRNEVVLQQGSMGWIAHGWLEEQIRYVYNLHVLETELW